VTAALDWIEQGLTSHSTHYRSFQRWWGAASARIVAAVWLQQIDSALHCLQKQKSETKNIMKKILKTWAFNAYMKINQCDWR